MGHTFLRRACNDCSSDSGNEARVYSFCRNSPTLHHDAFGLVTEEECQAQLNKDMAAVAKQGAKCATEAIGTGLTGCFVAIIGGAVGMICGKSKDVGVAVSGTIAIGWGLVDYCLYNLCMNKVHKAEAAARTRYDNCKKKVDE